MIFGTNKKIFSVSAILIPAAVKFFAVNFCLRDNTRIAAVAVTAR